MKFSADFITQVCGAHNIVDFISQHTELKLMSSGQYMGLCPFPDHKEKTPSFSVSENKQVYYCFGCKKSGNIYHFLEEIQGLHFVDAVIFLSEKAGISLSHMQGSKKEEQILEKKRKFLEINNFSCEYFKIQMKKMPLDLKNYFTERKLSEKIIEKFQIGYASDQWQGLCDFLRSKQVDLQLASDLGLIKMGKKGYFDMYRHRVTFSILSAHKKEIIGFGARTLDGAQNPKYINSSDSLIFNKSEILYGLSHALQEIRKEDQVIVVEGYMDYLSLYQAGIKNVVANLGTALTSSHIKTLKKYTQNILIFFDGDQAGQMALERSAQSLFKEGLFPRGLVLEDNHDPDDFLRAYGIKELKKRIKKAPELFYFLMTKAFEGYQGQGIEKVQIIERLKVYLEGIKDNTLKMIYCQSLADRLSVDLSYVKGLFSNSKTLYKAKQQFERVTERKGSGDYEFDLRGISQPELLLLNLALSDENYFLKIKDLGGFEACGHEGLRELWREILSYVYKPTQDFHHITSFLMNRIEPRESLQVLEAQHHWTLMNAEKKDRFFQDCLKKVKKQWLDVERKKLQSKLFTEKSDVDSKNILEQIVNIQKEKSQWDG